MDYGRLIGAAWAITWRRRFLWFFGLFAASSVGSCSTTSPPVQYQISSGDVGQWSAAPGAGAQEFGAAVSRWAIDNAGLIVLGVGLLLLLGLVVFVLSMISQGSMARATADLAMGRETSFGQAWRDGLRLFWRYLGLFLLWLAALIVAGIVAVIVVGIGAALIAATGGALRNVLIALVALSGVIAVLAATVLAIFATIVFAYAQRAIAVEDVDPWQATERGVNLLRTNLGPSLLVWLINVGLSIGAGILTGLIVAVVAVILAGVGFGLYAAGGFGPLTIAYIVIGALALIAFAWFLVAIANTFFWSYWTIAYLRLTGRVAEAR